ncbi:MAG TPA: DUF2157 domain-containing protein [Thermoanaerobaculia bacterium]|nr:DUF2157 domain-containing protein [Thermoanaerobaculia bacterium]
MNPDLVEAIGRLRREQVIADPPAETLLRVARAELVSVELELRTLLYAGVLLIVSGAGLFLKENHDRLGPVAIATLLGAAAAACLVYAARRLPAFTWQAAASDHLGADYVLLLGVLLFGADLGYLEAQLHLFGRGWPYHLLLLAGVAFVLAYRFDSRSVLSLALTSFAAWRGVSVSLTLAARGGATAPVIRWNAIGCGVLFLAGAAASVRWRRKAHFEGVYATLGLVLVLGALVSGAWMSSSRWLARVGQQPDRVWMLWELALLGVSAAVVLLAYRLRRPLDFSLGVLGAYLGILRLVWEIGVGRGASFMLVVAVTSAAVIAFLVRAQRRMKEAS